MSVTTILLFLLLVGYSLYSKINKMAAEQQPVEEMDSHEGGQDGMLFESEDDVESNHSDEYFTYESVEVKTPMRKKPAAVHAPVFAPAEEEAVFPQFNLRQAVIAQTILSNNYINEINQQNQ